MLYTDKCSIFLCDINSNKLGRESDIIRGSKYNRQSFSMNNDRRYESIPLNSFIEKYSRYKRKQCYLIIDKRSLKNRSERNIFINVIRYIRTLGSDIIRSVNDMGSY